MTLSKIEVYGVLLSGHTKKRFFKRMQTGFCVKNDGTYEHAGVIKLNSKNITSM